MFPPFSASLSDLYGAGSCRESEQVAHEADLLALDQEERAIESYIRCLVKRKAPTPLGVHFRQSDGFQKQQDRMQHITRAHSASEDGYIAPQQLGEGDDEDDEEEDEEDEEEEDEEDEEDDDDVEEDDMEEDSGLLSDRSDLPAPDLHHFSSPAPRFHMSDEDRGSSHGHGESADMSVDGSRSW